MIAMQANSVHNCQEQQTFKREQSNLSMVSIRSCAFPMSFSLQNEEKGLINKHYRKPLTQVRWNER